MQQTAFLRLLFLGTVCLVLRGGAGAGARPDDVNSAATAKTTDAKAVVVRLPLTTTGAASPIASPVPMPLKLQPTPPANVQKIPADLAAPQFASFTLGPKDAPTTITVALDAPLRGEPRLVVDANGDGDLTNDAPVAWTLEPYKANSGGAFQRRVGDATLTARYGDKSLPLHVRFFQYDPDDTERALYHDTLFATAEYARSGSLTLGGKTYAAALSDPNLTGDFRGRAADYANVYLLIDVNGNGTFDARGEAYDIAQPFTIKGVTYEIADMRADGDSFAVRKSARTAPEILPPPDLRNGQPAPAFAAKTTDGRTVKFPSDYQGRLVLLYFWASWCGDCANNAPFVLSAYPRFHSQGVDILAVSLDHPDALAQMQAYTREKNMPWPQIFDAKMWRGDLAQLYYVQEIPTAYLVDGDTGALLAGGKELEGAKLAPTLEKVLAARRNATR